jgi:hypothetical protein
MNFNKAILKNNMRTLYRIAIFSVLIPICVMGVLFINFELLVPALIGNIKSEDISDSNVVFFIFFEISSDTGYGIDISLFNMLLTYGIGVLIGIYLSKKIIFLLRLNSNQPS